MLFFFPSPYRVARRCMRRRRRSDPGGNVVAFFIFLWIGICYLIFTPLRAAGIDVDHAPVLGTIVAVIGFGLSGLLVWWGVRKGQRARRARPRQGPPPPPPPPPFDANPPDPPPGPRPVNRQAPIDRPYPFRPY